MKCAHCKQEIVRASREAPGGLIAVAWRHWTGHLFCYERGFQTATPDYSTEKVSR